MSDVTPLRGAAVAVQDERIAAVGPENELRSRHSGFTVVRCDGCILTPGLVDSHTHALFGMNRAHEQELRAAGADYMEIAARGGGIHASVRDLRGRPDDELFTLAVHRLRGIASYGTTTVEIKSGYGLSTEHELRMLRIIARLGLESGVRVVPTWLGAHEIPLDFRARSGGSEEYIELLVSEMLPQVALARLARFADIFCEPGVFSVEESRRVLRAASRAGLGIKLHADELHYSGGAELAADLGAVSADHLAAISETGIERLARSSVVATLLPGTMLFLGRSTRAPARRMIDAGCAVALATDFNPGTSPTVNLPLMMTLGEGQLGMSAAECIIAATVNGAAALGLAAEVGQIAPGFAADLALFEASDFRELPYWYGDRLCRGSWTGGKACHPFELPITS